MIYKRKMKVIERWHLRSGKLVNYPEKFRFIPKPIKIEELKEVLNALDFQLKAS
jgi:hypothetical protein